MATTALIAATVIYPKHSKVIIVNSSPAPRGRNGHFEPQLIKNSQTGITGMDDQIAEAGALASIVSQKNGMANIRV
ncbi:MAG: hypothetical protein ACJAUP_002864 [Cellvibrionaceae bacterium]